MPRRVIDPADLEHARQIVSAGGTYVEASRVTGISTDTLSRRLRKDPPPGRRPTPVLDDDGPKQPPKQAPPPAGRDPRPGASAGPRKRSRNRDGGPTDTELEAMLRKIAKAPAYGTKLILHCDFCTTHFLTSADTVAAELMELATDDSDLREMIEWAWREWRKVAWAGVFGTWLAVPAMHHMLPDRWYAGAVLLAGMPPREPSSQRHSHGPATPPAWAPPPAATNGAASNGTPPPPTFPSPFGDMSLGDLIETARAAGINLADYGLDDATIAIMLQGDQTLPPEPPATDASTESAATTEEDDDGFFNEPDPEDIDPSLTAIDEIAVDNAFSSAVAQIAQVEAADTDPGSVQ